MRKDLRLNKPVAAAGLWAALTAALLPACAHAGDRATGDWGGVRTTLADHGVEVEADYLGESMVLDGDDEISYLGNLDLYVTFDTEKLHAWNGGTVFVYGENKHGSGLSDDVGLLMQVTNLEASSFTQLSEFWLEQQLGSHIVVRLGKQDGNRDFASPRFAGNFINSSFGVLPGSPLPSYPAPALGVAVLADWTKWFGARAAIYEGEPRVESFGAHAFEDHAGVFGIASLHLHHSVIGQESAGEFEVGGWTHSGEDRSGVYGIYDLLLYQHPEDKEDERSVQGFVRGGWSPEQPDQIGTYVGGGLTAHGFLGMHNTIGVGTGYVKSDTTHETFVELMFKWRPRPWFTVEPDVQVYDTEHGHPVFFVLRVKLKL